MIGIEPKQGIAFVLCQHSTVWNCAKAQCHSNQIIGGAKALNPLQLDHNPPTIAIRLRMGHT
jgi:hypothetical protein